MGSRPLGDGDGGSGRASVRRDSGVGNDIAFVEEKDEFGVADADGVAVGDDFAVYGDAIDEGPVVAVQVREFEAVGCLLDGAVLARDYGIDQA